MSSCTDPTKLFYAPCSDMFKINSVYGNMYIIKVNPGGVLYSGNANVYMSNSHLPIGSDYYNYNGTSKDKAELNQRIVNAQQDVDAIVTSLPDIEPLIASSWYGSFQTATLYSRKSSVQACKNGECIIALRVKRNMPLVYINIESMMTILNFLKNNRDVVHNSHIIFKAIKTAFFNGLPLGISFDDYHKYFNRKSYYNEDRIFNNFIRSYITKIVGDIDIGGYCSESQNTFHEEYCIWNAARYLQRDLSNVNDYLYNPFVAITESPIKEWLVLMSSFQTYNVFGHQGNYLDHSSWACLNAEDHVSLLRPYKRYFKYAHFEKLSSLCAFLHDIGKISEQHDSIGTIKKKNYTAYISGDTEKVKHGYLGASLIMFDMNIENMSVEL